MSDKTIAVMGLENASMMVELFGNENENITTMIPISSLREFKGHPFKVLDNEKMDELVESIKANGVLTPVTVRECGIGTYEMISGHRRWHASQLAGLTEIPAIIKDLTDDEAVIAMVDANIQREEILPSEKAFAYKMRLEAIKNQAKREEEEGEREIGVRSDEILAEGTGESARTIQRYIRLTELIPEFLQLVDEKKISFMLGVEMSHLPEKVQRNLYNYFLEGGTIKREHIKVIKEHPNMYQLNQRDVNKILKGDKPKKEKSKKRVFTLSEKDIDKYFGPDVTMGEIQKIIIDLLENRKNR